MTWDEDWRDSERASVSELDYALIPNRQAWKIMIYFTILPIATFIVLSTIGRQPAVIAGWPLLLLIIIAMTLLYVAGLYTLIRIPEKRRAKKRREAEG